MCYFQIAMQDTFPAGRTDPSTLNTKLLCPVFDVFFQYLPEKMRKPLRFGVRHGEVWIVLDVLIENHMFSYFVFTFLLASLLKCKWGSRSAS